MATTSVNTSNSSNSGLLIVIIGLLCICVYFLMGFSLTLGNKTLGMQQALLKHEYAKVGGKENYDLQARVQFLSLSDPQNPYNITNMKTYIDSFDGGTGKKVEVQNTDTPQVLATDAMQTVLSGAAIEGNKDADIIAIEYSDMECPYCVKQYHDTKLWESLKKQYGETVKFAYKNNRGVNHAGTEAKAIGILCAQKVSGDAAYVKMYHTIMDGTTGSSMYSVANLPEAAKTAGADMAKWKECFDTKATLDIFTAQTAEAHKYGLSGTPGTLLLNTKTGKYATVTGAHEFPIFTAKIDTLK